VNNFINKFVNWEKKVSFIIKTLIFVVLAAGLNYLSSILIQYVEEKDYYSYIIYILSFGQALIFLSLFNKSNYKLKSFKSICKNNYVNIIKNNLFIYFTLAYFSAKSFFPGLSFLFLNLGAFLLLPLIEFLLLYLFNNYKSRLTKVLKTSKNILFVLIVFSSLFLLNKVVSHIFENFVLFIQIIIRDAESSSIQLFGNFHTVIPIFLSLLNHLSIIFQLLFILIYEYEELVQIVSCQVDNKKDNDIQVCEYSFDEDFLLLNSINLENEIVIRGPNTLR
jgi:hypothetical protein